MFTSSHLIIISCFIQRQIYESGSGLLSVRLSVCLSVCHKPVFYRKAKQVDWFWHEVNKNEDTSFLKIAPNTELNLFFTHFFVTVSLRLHHARNCLQQSSDSCAMLYNYFTLSSTKREPFARTGVLSPRPVEILFAQSMT